MTYLIALIIAIALGAVIALLSFVNIGSGFGNQSAAAKAQQFSQAGSQLEVAMAAYLADNAESGFTTDLGTTVGVLQGDNWLKESPVAPTGQGVLGLYQNGNDVYLTLSTDGTDSPSNDVCSEIQNLGGNAASGTIIADATSLDGSSVSAFTGTARLLCDAATAGGNVAVFKVE